MVKKNHKCNSYVYYIHTYILHIYIYVDIYISIRRNINTNIVYVFYTFHVT